MKKLTLLILSLVFLTAPVYSQDWNKELIEKTIKQLKSNDLEEEGIYCQTYFRKYSGDEIEISYFQDIDVIAVNLLKLGAAKSFIFHIYEDKHYKGNIFAGMPFKISHSSDRNIIIEYAEEQMLEYIE